MDDRFLSHVRERNSWPRITKLRHNCFAQQLDSLDQSKSKVDDSATAIGIKVRLQPFERIVLQDTLDYLSAASDPHEEPLTISDLDADVAGTILFFRWSWADNVLRRALTEFDPGWVAETHDGNFQSALEVFKKQLRTRVRGRKNVYDRRYYRTEQLIKDNEWLASADGVDVDKLSVLPHPGDLGLWRLLGAYVLKNVDRMVTWPGFGVEAAGLLELYRSGEDSFSSAVRSRVLESFEKTPDFPPRDLFDGIGDEVDSESSASGEEAEERMGSDKADDSAILLETEAERERVQDWANITARNILDAEELWVVWSWCRMALVSHQNIHHDPEMKQFMACKDVMEYWKIAGQPEKPLGNHTAVVSAKPFSEILSKRPSEIASLLFHEDPQEYLDVEFRQQLHLRSIGDPKDYLHFIPWTALSELDLHEMEDELDYGLGLRPENLSGTLCAYQPRAEVELRVHELYLTDDLFPPHVEKNYRYPAYATGNMIVFLKQKLESSAQIRQLGLFWELWNDSAITLDPSTDTFYLLQTLPGVKARILEEKAGIWSAFEFFDSRYRNRGILPLQQNALREILGSKYDPAYADFLIYIDARELDLTPKTGNLPEIGKGSFGRVYKVEWNKKPVKLATTYSALGGDSSGCIPFYGFCRVLVDNEGRILSGDPSQPLPDGSMETFALVFDFADKGNLENFLKSRLELGKPDENWLKGVAHRDIHICNILVQTVSIPEEGEIEFDCLLSDLGEGKACVDDEAVHTTTEPDIAITSQAFSADANPPSISILGVPPIPELIRKHRIRSAKAEDIYALGLLAVKIIKDNYKLLCDETGEIRYPAALMRVLERCIDRDPAGRLDAASLVLATDEVLDGPKGLAGGEETEWYDSSYSLPQPGQPQVNVGSESDDDENDELGSSWLGSVKTSGWT